MHPLNHASKFRWPGLTLRQTLFLGAGLGILIPALLLSYFQIVGKLEAEVEVRVREPMRQYTEVLSRGLAAAIWNVDKAYAIELMSAVMRNPDVVSVTATDDFREVFAKQEKTVAKGGVLVQDQRDIDYNGKRVGQLLIVMSTARVQNEMINNLFKLVLALTAQVTISLIFIWLMFERRMMRPLKILQEGAQRLAQGELDQPLQWTRQDEMGGLAQGLDTMRSKLATLLAEREQKNAALQIELEDRKRMEAALVVSQAKFAGIFDASPIAMTVSRMGGDYAVFDVNTAWTRTFALDRETALRYKREKPGIWKTLADQEIVLERLRVSGEVSRAPAWMRRGHDLPDMLCEISGRVLELGGEPLLILAYEDVTQRHQYEVDILQLNTTLEHRVANRTQELTRTLDQLTAAKDELVRSEKLSALGALVAGIAHELNTPIGNSLTVASTLQHHSIIFGLELSKGITRTRLEEYVASTTSGAEILMRALQHAAELVTSFKQVAVDQTSVNRRQFKLGPTVAEILITLGPALRKTTHTVQCAIPEDITLDSYPGPLGQILTNLINNAVLHAFEGTEHGVISINAELLPGSRVKLSVQDDGLGIAPENLAKVFDPFFTTKFGRGGSGLGLNIVYNLVTNSLGGSIRVDSALGLGACFTLELPLSVQSTATEGTEIQ